MTHLAVALREEDPARRDPDSSDRDPDGRLRALHRPSLLRPPARAGQPVLGRAVGTLLVLRDADRHGVLPVLRRDRGRARFPRGLRDQHHRRLRRAGVPRGRGRGLGGRPAARRRAHPVRLGDHGDGRARRARGAARRRRRRRRARAGGARQRRGEDVGDHRRRLALRPRRPARRRRVLDLLHGRQHRRPHRPAAHRAHPGARRLPLGVRPRGHRHGRRPHDLRPRPARPALERRGRPRPAARRRLAAAGPRRRWWSSCSSSSASRRAS